jgi:hypothetical protein
VNEAQNLLFTALVAAAALVVGACFDLSPVGAAVTGLTLVVAVAAGVAHCINDEPDEDEL